MENLVVRPVPSLTSNIDNQSGLPTTIDGHRRLIFLFQCQEFVTETGRLQRDSIRSVIPEGFVLIHLSLCLVITANVSKITDMAERYNHKTVSSTFQMSFL